MERIVADIVLVISLCLGVGISIQSLHGKARSFVIAAAMKKQPSLSAFTQKLTEIGTSVKVEFARSQTPI